MGAIDKAIAAQVIALCGYADMPKAGYILRKEVRMEQIIRLFKGFI